MSQHHIDEVLAWARSEQSPPRLQLQYILTFRHFATYNLRTAPSTAAIARRIALILILLQMTGWAVLTAYFLGSEGGFFKGIFLPVWNAMWLWLSGIALAFMGDMSGSVPLVRTKARGDWPYQWAQTYELRMVCTPLCATREYNSFLTEDRVVAPSISQYMPYWPCSSAGIQCFGGAERSVNYTYLTHGLVRCYTSSLA